MLAVASFSMKGATQAFIATLVFSALTVWLAPFGVIVGALIALVTLRIGVIEGLKTLIVAGATSILLSTTMLGSYWPGLVSIMEYMLPVWIASVVLRNTNSLALALNAIMMLVGLLVIGFHLMVGDTEAWWIQLYNTQLAPLLEQAGVDFKELDVTQMVSMITLLMAIFAVTLWFSIVLLGRWWQSKLYYPGRFREDFYQLRLPKNVAYVTVVFAVLGLVLDGNNLIQDLSSVLMAGLMFQGLAIIHFAVNQRALNTGWLVGLYVLLLLFPQTLLVLATVGLLDIWMNVRVRLQKD
ncbi:DUF2232 domain-containing protein [Thiosulfativibrio zosterae]|uniref:DUF2232 domain-containing protein n=1 Tax=Thiosulfativibrio zosterae TaxID=2675053 RepID=A0A6F8PN93_9GAMM|nr:DUF2232 domain-containing protein [Thiosulfativibrio zosterae]BBP43579.1 hypothetical protein THMIRHAT_13250 [Thiosulfativibrio zosterae]